MKKIYSALLSMVLVLGLSTGVKAATFDINFGNPILVPDSFEFGNGTSANNGVKNISFAAGSVVDYWNFSVDSNALFASTTTTVGFTAFGLGFTSFATTLETYVNDGWSQIAAGLTQSSTTSLGALRFESLMEFSALSPDPAQYRIKVAGTKFADAAASYSGVMTVAPIPEPEIYAMMAAGLGLMGFVARRRQRNGAVA